MARVIVKFYATVREAVGTDCVRAQAESVADLIRVLGDMFGPRFSDLMSSIASDPDSIVVLINGRNPGRTRLLSKALSEGDEVAIFPPVSGG